MDTPPQAPASAPWSDLLGEGAARAFIHVVETELRARGIPAAMQPDGSVRITGPLRRSIRLEELAARCQAATPGEWTDLVHAYFGAAFAEDVRPDPPPGRSLPLEAMRSHIKLCLYDEAEVRSVRGVGRMFIPGVVAIVVVDIPHAMEIIAPETAAAWGLGDDELFALAGTNVQQQDQPRRAEIALAPKGAVVAYEGASRFTATFGLWMEPMTTAGSHGVVFSVPNRHRVLAHAIADSSVMQAITTMVPATQHLFRQGPESISPELFWSREGAYSVLRTRVDEGRVRFDPSPEFSAMLSQLPAAGA